MLRTSLTDLLQCSLPLQQAPMGGVTTTGLAAAVTEAGGIAMLPLQFLSSSALEQMLDELQRQTSGPFGLTFLMPFFDPACLEMAARAARLVDFYYGDPDTRLVDQVHTAGALASWQVSSVEEAVADGRPGTT